MSAEQTGQKPKIVATFSVSIDEAGDCISKVDGPFPMKDLYVYLSLTTAGIMQQWLAQQMQAMMAAQQRRVLMPDGSLPPPGMHT